MNYGAWCIGPDDLVSVVPLTLFLPNLHLNLTSPTSKILLSTRTNPTIACLFCFCYASMLSQEFLSLVFIWISTGRHSQLCLNIKPSRKNLPSRSQTPELDSLYSRSHTDLASVYHGTYLNAVITYVVFYADYIIEGRNFIF